MDLLIMGLATLATNGLTALSKKTGFVKFSPKRKGLIRLIAGVLSLASVVLLSAVTGDTSAIEPSVTTLAEALFVFLTGQGAYKLYKDA